MDGAEDATAEERSSGRQEQAAADAGTGQLPDGSGSDGSDPSEGADTASGGGADQE